MTVHKFFPEHKAGTEVLTLKIAKELMSRGHEILVVTASPPDIDARHASGPDFSEYEYEGVKVHSIGEALRLRGYTFRHEYEHPEMGKHFAKLIDNFKPDLVHVMHAQNLSGSVISVSKNKKLPVVLSPTDFWFICPIVQLKRPDNSVCEGPGPGAANCLTCYTPQLIPPADQISEAISRRVPALKGAFAGTTIGKTALQTAYSAYKFPAAVKATVDRPAYLRDIANSADAITVPTLLMKRLFTKNGINNDLIHHIQFGIDQEKLLGYQEKKPSKVLRIGYVGTLYDHKGVDILIKAFQRLTPIKEPELKIYGSTEQFAEYSKYLKELAQSDAKSSKRIHFLGAFHNDLFGEVLSGIDVLVVPSIWYENTPLVMQSALTTKTPLIASDLGGMSELINHGKDGFVFKVRDDKDLAEKLQLLVDQPDLLSKFRANIGPQRSISVMVDDLEAVYKKVYKHI